MGLSLSLLGQTDLLRAMFDEEEGRRCISDRFSKGRSSSNRSILPTKNISPLHPKRNARGRISFADPMDRWKQMTSMTFQSSRERENSMKASLDSRCCVWLFDPWNELKMHHLFRLIKDNRMNDAFKLRRSIDLHQNIPIEPLRNAPWREYGLNELFFLQAYSLYVSPSPSIIERNIGRQSFILKMISPHSDGIRHLHFVICWHLLLRNSAVFCWIVSSSLFVTARILTKNFVQ